jgi:hypothetical protein
MNFFLVSSWVYCLNICGERFDFLRSLVGRICFSFWMADKISCITWSRSLFFMLVCGFYDSVEEDGVGG